ncbi:hypothetical protein JCGZ_06544 [Jatropha curcas]|uniref:NAC domain-containing protein n=1 Tax=Jatropha curcas TaxID=180498 RepID=A0A067LE82_JATCU|nr:hypothetical protein JCGZ_06544 [Jatropha curcas]
MDENSLMLRPGFRFCPTEDELVNFYLQSKVDNKLPFYAEAVVKTLDDRRGLYSNKPWNIFSKETPSNGYFYVFTKLMMREDNLTVEQPSVSVSLNASLVDIMVDHVWFRDDISTLSPVDDVDLWFGDAISTLSPDNRTSEVESANSDHNN